MTKKGVYETVRLGDVIEQIRGVSYKPSDLRDNLSDDSVVLLRANNIQDGKIVLDDVVYVSKSKVSKSQFLRQGDILVCTSSGSKELVGKAAFIDDDLPMVFGAFCKVVRPKIECCKYMGHFFQSPYYRKHISEASTGANINNLKNEHVADLHFSLPPLEEQRKIAAVLDKVSDLIVKRRTQLNKLDELVKARFVEMFGELAAPECKHVRYKLEEICVNSDDIKCGPFGTQLSKNEYQKHGIAVWEIPQINSGFKIPPTHFLTDEKAKQLDTYSLIPGDIAMSRKGNVGRCALFPKDFAPGIIHSDVLRIRVDNRRVNPCFLMYQLHFSKAVTHQIDMISSGAVMAGINVTKLKQIYVHIPAFNLQQQFAVFVKQTEKTKTAISRSLEKLETLKKALMQKYFGKPDFYL